MDTTTSLVIDALRNRRSAGVVRPERPTRDEIAHVIEAAAWAPNHHKTEPWRFVVLAGSERERLGDVMANSLHSRLDPDTDETPILIERERRKPLRAPVIIAVWVCPATSPKVVPEEEMMATAAAVHSMLLAAEAHGLAAMWRTGPAARDPAVKRFLDIPEDATIAAFIYLGYPAPLGPRGRDRDALRYAIWRGWDD